MDSDGDTIFALASAVGRAAVAIIRISGSRTSAAVVALAGRLPPSRRASLCYLHNAQGEVLDRALVLWVMGPASYTGEDYAEFQLHGSAAVVAGVTDALVALGLRPAEPGEFTRRAFVRGRMDLTEAEAVIDLIDAETASQRVQALRQLGGALSRQFGIWREQLVGLLAQQEALIDFPDEDLPTDVEDQLVGRLNNLRSEIGAHLNDEKAGEKLRHGISIVVLGPPNVGKSSLINCLAERDVAIVSTIPGTTRDVLEARIVLGGVPVTLMDTAGLRVSDDPIEIEGIRRAQARASNADIVLVLRNRDSLGEVWEVPPDKNFAIAEGDSGLSSGPIVIPLLTKIDLLPDARSDVGLLGISVVTEAGLDTLKSRLEREIFRLTRAGVQAPLTRARHRAALREALAHLDSAGLSCVELRAEEFRLALNSLGRVTGRVGVEEVLGHVFSQFCIGK